MAAPPESSRSSTAGPPAVEAPDTHRPTALDRPTLLHLYRQMTLIRCFEEQVLDLYARALIPGTTHVSIGQEAVAAGVCGRLRRDDYITITHRGHGQCLAKGAAPDRMFAELFGRAEGYCRGKGGSMHIADHETGNLGANGIVGGSLAIAAGAALSAKLRQTDSVVASFFGDGAANQGLLSESLNMAALWRLPVIYVCENNSYGEYTPAGDVTAGEISRRAEPFGIASVVVDGMDVLEVYEAAGEAVERARQGAGPTFLVCDTYRFFGHGVSDRERPYRTREEEQAWEERDPIEQLRRRLLSDGFARQSELDDVAMEVERDVLAGVEFARNARQPAPEEVTEHVYAD